MNTVFSKMFAPWKRRILLMIGRAIIHATADNQGRMVVKLTALASETHDGVELMQDYGFASRPLPGCEAIIASVMGERSQTVAVASDDKRYRPQDLAVGESVLFDDQGQMVAVRRGHIEIISSKKVIITAPIVEVNSSTVTVTADTVTVNSSDLVFGGGDGDPTAAVARVGDQVQVGSSTGTIISGSNKMKVG